MRIFCAAWMIAAALCGGAGSAFAQGLAPAGTVTELQGTVTVTRQNGAQPLQAGDQVLADDVLETGAAAKLLVTFTDGTKLTLGPNAEVMVDEFVYNPNGGNNNAALRVTAGAARVVAGALERVGGSQAIKVATPVATIGMRGTDFFIEMEDDHLSVALFSGFEVAVSNAAGETVLRPGEGTDIWGGGAPSQALTWGADRVNRALRLVSVTSIYERPLPYAQPKAMANSLDKALIQGVFKFDVRYRYELVDHDSQPRNARASTLRLRAGYETLAWNGLFAGIEGEITREIGNDRRSDGVINSPALPLIPDPESETLNQVYVGWTMAGDDDLTAHRAVVGRQRMAFENERWIGPGAFRQNDQTFDAVMLQARPLPGVSVRYAYVDRINRILGNNPNGRWQSDSHFIGATTNLTPFGLTTAYAYLLDLKPVPLMSSATYGVRYDAMIDSSDELTFGLEAEVARQTDYAANPRNYAVTYALVRPSVKWRDLTLAAGWEHLGGNGLSALQTPLATLHRHNGWADVFTTTPANGLRDFNVRLMQEFPDVGFVKNAKLDLRYHDFAATRGGANYGTEFDADFNVSVLGRATAGVRFAYYNAKSFDADTTKLWLYVEFQY